MIEMLTGLISNWFFGEENKPKQQSTPSQQTYSESEVRYDNEFEYEHPKIKYNELKDLLNTVEDINLEMSKASKEFQILQASKASNLYNPFYFQINLVTADECKKIVGPKELIEIQNTYAQHKLKFPEVRQELTPSAILALKEEDALKSLATELLRPPQPESDQHHELVKVTGEHYIGEV